MSSLMTGEEARDKWLPSVEGDIGFWSEEALAPRALAPVVPAWHEPIPLAPVWVQSLGKEGAWVWGCLSQLVNWGQLGTDRT